MTRATACTERRRRRGRAQRGDALFEALIGFVLLMVLGLGLSYAAARALHSQRYANTQGIALNQMRGLLQEKGVQTLCDPGTSTDSIRITPAGATALQIPVSMSNCQHPDVTVGVAANTALTVTLSGSTTRIYTRMSLGTSADDDNARSLLGDSSTVLSQ